MKCTCLGYVYIHVYRPENLMLGICGGLNFKSKVHKFTQKISQNRMIKILFAYICICIYLYMYEWIEWGHTVVYS